jgi:transcriptional regulator with XRE-family HTH domain
MTTGTTTKNIAINLKSIRNGHHLTQAELAKKATISTNYYARIERGDTSISVAVLEKLTKALKVRSSDILPF